MPIEKFFHQFEECGDISITNNMTYTETQLLENNVAFME